MWISWTGKKRHRMGQRNFHETQRGGGRGERKKRPGCKSHGRRQRQTFVAKQNKSHNYNSHLINYWVLIAKARSLHTYSLDCRGNRLFGGSVRRLSLNCLHKTDIWRRLEQILCSAEINASARTMDFQLRFPSAGHLRDNQSGLCAFTMHKFRRNDPNERVYLH